MSNQQDNWREEFNKEFGEFPSLKFFQEDGVVKTVEIAQWNNVKDFIDNLVKQTEQRIREEKDREFEEILKSLIQAESIATNTGVYPLRGKEFIVEFNNKVNELLSAIKSKKYE